MCKKPPKRRKVGDTIRVLIHDEDGNEVNPADVDAEIQWYANGVALLGEDDAEIYVSSNMAGAVLSVTVTIADEEYTDVTKAVAGEDKSAEIELVDDYGLQSDGTGIIGDKLTVTYGADFGTPTNVSWYKNGKVVATNSVGDVVNDGLTRTITAAEWGTGTYKVTITNTDGDMATTNEIVITDKEEAAEITDFDIEDDYTLGTNLVYATSNTNAVVTVSLQKNYLGTFRIFRASDASYRTPIASFTTSVAAPLGTAAQVAARAGLGGVVADDLTLLASNKPNNNQVINTAVNGFGIGYIEDDGTVTYKIQIDEGLTRGTEYVITFDQQSITTDTPGTGTANAYSEKVTAPYVELPASIEVTKVSNGNHPEISFKDAEGATLGWLGHAGDANAAPPIAAANTLARCGFNAAHVYGSTALTNDSSASTVSELAGITTADQLLNGVWTAGALANTRAYWFAYVSTTPGIYGQASVTLKSEAVPVAQDSATDMDLTQNSDTATTARVTFSNLRTDGTVYIVRGSYSDDTNNAIINPHYTSAAQIFSKFSASDGTTYTASAPVTAGTASIDIPSAIGVPTGISSDNGAVSANATPNDFNTDDYIAVFIPDDDVHFGMIYTDGGIGTTATVAAAAGVSYNSSNGLGAGRNSLHVAQALKKYKLHSQFGSVDLADSATAAAPYHIENGALVGTANVLANVNGYVLEWIDQFGNHMNQAAGPLTWNLKADVATMATDALMSVTYTPNTLVSTNASALAGNNYDTIALTGTDGTTPATFSAGDKWVATLATGQTLTLTCRNAAAANAAGSTWRLSLS